MGCCMIHAYTFTNSNTVTALRELLTQQLRKIIAQTSSFFSQHSPEHSDSFHISQE